MSVIWFVTVRLTAPALLIVTVRLTVIVIRIVFVILTVIVMEDSAHVSRFATVILIVSARQDVIAILTVDVLLSAVVNLYVVVFPIAIVRANVNVTQIHQVVEHGHACVIMTAHVKHNVHAIPSVHVI